jgi:hypothetical protein
MSIPYIRKTYGIPARQGARVRYRHPNGVEVEGVITGSRGAYLKILLEGYIRPLLFHPTWNLNYLEGEPDE